jgi:hypothetical protein
MLGGGVIISPVSRGGSAVARGGCWKAVCEGWYEGGASLFLSSASRKYIETPPESRPAAGKNIQNHHIEPPGTHVLTAKAMKTKTSPMKNFEKARSMLGGPL